MPERRTAGKGRRTARDERAGDDDFEPGEDEPSEDEPGDEEAPRGRDAGRRKRGADHRTRGADHRTRGADHRISAAEAARAGARNLHELIGKRPEGITAIEPTDDGWLVGVEMLEDQRVPSSSDILAIYEAELDAQGELVSYRRTRRYPRGRGDDGGDR